MNQSTLCSHVAPPRPAGVLRATADAEIAPLHPEIAESLARNESVALADSGTFSTRARGAREGRNPAMGERIAVPAFRTSEFKAEKTLRESVNARNRAESRDTEP